MKPIFGIKGFDVREYGISANAMLGIRDSGKTYDAMKAAEELFDADIPWVGFDPIGVWHNIRIPGKGKGYPVVVAGGRHGDLPLTTKNCGAIVRAAMESRISLVLDLFSMELSKADWRRIVREATEILLHENHDHGLRHVFIEEAGEFVPQRVQDGQVFAAVEKLVRMGGNSKLGCTLINQRSADLNKSVLELCANVFVHRQKGKNTILDLKKWFEVLELTDAERAKIESSLPNLKSGECWALLHDVPKPVFLKVPEKNSLHPDRRSTVSKEDAAKRKPVPADAFVEAMKAKLAPKSAPQKIVKVDCALTQPAHVPSMIKFRAEAFAEGQQDGWQRGWMAGWHKGQEHGRRVALVRVGEASIAAKEAPMDGSQVPPMPKGAIPAFTPAPKIEVGMRVTERDKPDRVISAVTQSAPRAPRIVPRGDGSVTLPPGERAVLICAAQFDGVDRDQLSVLTGYKRSSRDAYIQRLREKGYIAINGQTISITDDGANALPPDYEPLPTGADLQAYWLQRLPEGERKVLMVLIEAYPGSVERSAIDDATRYQRSSRDAYLQRMKAKRLWVPDGKKVRAVDALF